MVLTEVEDCGTTQCYSDRHSCDSACASHCQPELYSCDLKWHGRYKCQCIQQVVVQPLHWMCSLILNFVFLYGRYTLLIFSSFFFLLKHNKLIRFIVTCICVLFIWVCFFVFCLVFFGVVVVLGGFLGPFFNLRFIECQGM